MGEAETCGDCRKWEEKMYWTHFQKIQFFLSLVGDFVDEMAMPKKFVNHLKKKLPEAVTLKGPSGVIWDVSLVTNGDNLLFKKGWKEFVINHSLEENDLLIFQYHGDSCFDVLMFDRHSSCEKETSYFVRKCGHKKHDVGHQTSEKARDSCVEDIPPASDDVGCGQTKLNGGRQTTKKTRDHSLNVIHVGLDNNVESPLPKKSKNDEDAMPTSSVRRNVPWASRKIQKVSRSIKAATPKRKISKKTSSTSAVGDKVISDAEQNTIEGSEGYQLQYVSDRRSITEAEKEKALQLAHAALTSESFIVVMRPTHVYKRFYLTIPSEWATRHLSLENQDVILIYKENTWCAEFNCNKQSGFGGLSGGWKDFSVENNLEEYDVCRFELARPAGRTVVMNVSIFRVVEEITPLTLVTSASSPPQNPLKYARRKSSINCPAK